MIMVPDWIMAEMFGTSWSKGDRSLRRRSGTVAAHARGVHPPAGMTLVGKHHGIYLSDPRRVEAAKLRTILRQPVA
jgi:hypothetical protein